MSQDEKPNTHPPKSSPATDKGDVKRSVETGQGETSFVESADNPAHVAQNAAAPQNDLPDERPEEFGGQSGLEPTRYGDWEKKGRCTDF